MNKHAQTSDENLVGDLTTRSIAGIGKQTGIRTENLFIKRRIEEEIRIRLAAFATEIDKARKKRPSN